MDAETKMMHARVRLVLDRRHTFFGTLALHLKLEESYDKETMATDGVHLWYNPNFVDTLSCAENNDEICGVVAHEIMHCALKHFARIGNRDIRKFNIASDFAINLLLKDTGFSLPGKPLLNEKYRGWTSERIYADLDDEQLDKSKQDPGGCGEVVHAPKNKKGESTDAELDQKWSVAVVNAAKAAKRRGTLPAGLERLVGDMLRPQVAWEVFLDDFIQRHARNDYCWSTPSRRFASYPIIIPAIVSNEISDIVFVQDTSGSVNSDALRIAGGEISEILGKYDTTTHFLCVDAKVASHTEITRADLPLKMRMTGGGGTSFTPAFDWVEENGINPCCLIYVTDMMGSFPDQAPEYPVIWLRIDTKINPPFGHVIDVETK